MNKNKYYPIYEDLKYKIQHGEYKEEEEYKKLVLFNLKSTELNEIIALSEKYSVLKKLVDFWNNNNLI
ncbi:hypothetical protein LHV46_13080 [Enterococcus faecium]|uniref:hypothetical protein n=1 Tax=Enterococcus faecium TaxID=1352 RepID=UPI0010209DBB|nr:hypothetical protein [Enterococcus faecium]MCH5408098.1 hypothetical protein [Enterococcus faecium]RYK59159.1 hypothetical protein EWI10_13100 [Enterococcus faecium]